jgi:phosphatidylserine/phosphatidylglycerophosphate/cardiolipin synthase-like enzyme
VLVDRRLYNTNPAERKLMAQLTAGGVTVHLSNPIFRLSFEKDLVIDRRRVLIMTMCLEPATFTDTRDYGLVLARTDIIRGVARVFDTDWDHSAPPGVAPPSYNPTPPLKVPDLIWSPVDSSDKLTALIQKARHTIDATTEWLNDRYLESELIAAVQRGVRVRLILPQTPRNNSSNSAGIALLASNGVQVHVTIGQHPPAGAVPYMHAKTMIVDGRIAELGSIDLQTAAVSNDRELAIIFRQRRFVRQLSRQLQSDWASTPTPAAATAVNSSASA